MAKRVKVPTPPARPRRQIIWLVFMVHGPGRAIEALAYSKEEVAWSIARRYVRRWAPRVIPDKDARRSVYDFIRDGDIPAAVGRFNELLVGTVHNNECVFVEKTVLKNR